jgi:hypothetical protein
MAIEQAVEAKSVLERGAQIDRAGQQARERRVGAGRHRASEVAEQLVPGLAT